MQQWTRWLVLAAMVTATMVALAACGGGDADDSAGSNGSGGPDGELEQLSGDSAGDGGTDDRAEESAGDGNGSGGGDANGGSSAPGTDLAIQDGGRKVSFRTELELASEDVEGTYRDITDLARQRGGYVSEARLRTTAESDEEQRATVTVRVPAEGQDAVLADIRGLGGVTVESESTTAREVTEEYTDLQSRLRNLERSETRYLELMNAAENVTEILEVTERLDRVRSEIEQIQGRLNVLDDQVDFATISATIVPRDEETGDEDDDPSSFVDAWNAAWEQFGDAGQVAIAALAWVSAAAIVVAPVLAIAAGVRLATRRRSHSEA